MCKAICISGTYQVCINSFFPTPFLDKLGICFSQLIWWTPFRPVCIEGCEHLLVSASQDIDQRGSRKLIRRGERQRSCCTQCHGSRMTRQHLSQSSMEVIQQRVTERFCCRIPGNKRLQILKQLDLRQR